MTKLIEQIEQMRVRLSEIASNEQALIKALGDALNRLDQALLRDVRSLASEHEVRREAILGELQGLAAGIGMFRAPLRPSPEELPSYMPAHGPQPAISPGDWRRATSNIEDELEFPLNGSNGHTPAH
jgi:hypothetical protein